MTNGCDISSEIALRRTPLDDDKSTLVQVMAYLNHCWPRSLPPYGITRPQWVNSVWPYYATWRCRFLFSFVQVIACSLRRRHNDHAGVSNHQPHGCLLNRLFRRKSKKTSKLRVTGLCAGNSPGTGEFPAQMASYAENVSIWWRHHVRVPNQSITWTNADFLSNAPVGATSVKFLSKFKLSH